MLRENELYIELQNSFPNPTLYLCENENPNTRDKKKDINIDYYMCLVGTNKLLNKNINLYYLTNDKYNYMYRCIIVYMHYDHMFS